MNVYDLLNERNLPSLLVMKDGTEVKTPEDFEKRREEIKTVLQEKEYGMIPPRPDHMRVEILNEVPSFAAGRAVLRKLKMIFEVGEKEFSFIAHSIIPKAEGPHPAFVHINFFPEIPNKYQPTESIINRGYAVFTFNYKDVASDDDDFTNGVAPYLVKSRRRSNSTSKICLWAWAAMRMMDYIEALPEIDKDNVAVIGHSRLGKTALVAGGFDERFKYVISNDSGMSGAAVTRGKVGEDAPTITRVFPFWFCPWFINHADKSDKHEFDQHFLTALTVPRHLMVGSAEEDVWADPTSEFLGALAVNEAYKLYGMDGLVHGDELPKAEVPLSEGDSHYHMRTDAHYLSIRDWDYYMNFIDRFVK